MANNSSNNFTTKAIKSGLSGNNGTIGGISMSGTSSPTKQLNFNPSPDSQAGGPPQPGSFGGISGSVQVKPSLAVLNSSAGPQTSKNA